MAKRFTSTEIWEEDWFLDMPNEYKLFWYYMLSMCNHAGLFKVNVKKFCGLNEVNLTSTKALEYFNAGKQRIRVISESVWLIEDFFFFQYGTTFNPNSKVHASIETVYNQHNIKMTSIRGLTDLKERVKDKDKEIKKGGVGENKIHGVEFINGTKVKLSDETFQELGVTQKLRALQNDIKPQEILKGKIY